MHFHSKEIIFSPTVVQQKLLLLLFFWVGICFLQFCFTLGGMEEKMEPFNLLCSLLVSHCSFIFSPFILVFKCGFLWPLETACSADPF